MSADHNPPNRRAEVDHLIADDKFDRASTALRELWRRETSSATAAFVATRLDQLREKLPLTKFKLAFLRSFTVEPIIPLLRAEAFAYGIDLEIHVGDFNTYVQDIVDPQSSLYRFAPNAAILAVRAEDVAPDLTINFADQSPEAAQQAAARVARSYEQWVNSFRQHSHAALIIHALECRTPASLGVLDNQTESGQSGLIRQINRELRRIASAQHGVYILDYDALVARHGSEHWHDERKWQMARLPISADHLLHMAREWMRFLVPLTGRTAKCLVVDLDNTLWGGIIGEDGMIGIKVSAEYPGAAFQSLHRAELRPSEHVLAPQIKVCARALGSRSLRASGTHDHQYADRPQHRFPTEPTGPWSIAACDAVRPRARPPCTVIRSAAPTRCAVRAMPLHDSRPR